MPSNDSKIHIFHKYTWNILQYTLDALGHKRGFNKIFKVSNHIMHISNHNGIKLEINRRRNILKYVESREHTNLKNGSKNKSQ